MFSVAPRNDEAAHEREIAKKKMERRARAEQRLSNRRAIPKTSVTYPPFNFADLTRINRPCCPHNKENEEQEDNKNDQDDKLEEPELTPPSSRPGTGFRSGFQPTEKRAERILTALTKMYQHDQLSPTANQSDPWDSFNLEDAHMLPTSQFRNSHTASAVYTKGKSSPLRNKEGSSTTRTMRVGKGGQALLDNQLSGGGDGDGEGLRDTEEESAQLVELRKRVPQFYKGLLRTKKPDPKAWNTHLYPDPTTLTTKPSTSGTMPVFRHGRLVPDWPNTYPAQNRAANAVHPFNQPSEPIGRTKRAKRKAASRKRFMSKSLSAPSFTAAYAGSNDDMQRTLSSRAARRERRVKFGKVLQECDVDDDFNTRMWQV